MGNQVTTKTSFNIIDNHELKDFLSNINVLDGFFMDTNLSISSKCLVIINNLINHLSISCNCGDDLYNYRCCDIIPGVSIQFDKDSLNKVEKFKSNCQLIKHLSIFNSNYNTVEEFIELNNFLNLISLRLENIAIKFVQHLKFHRQTLIKLCVHNCISDLASLIELCGGDQSFSMNWTTLKHLDIRYNKLRSIDNSVSLLTSLTVLDLSRNELHHFTFVEKIPTLHCLNVSYNCIKEIPKVKPHGLQVLLIGYNYLESLTGIQSFAVLSTLNASYNMITNICYVQELRELNSIKDLVLKGNPICTSENYRLSILNIVSACVNFSLDGVIFSKKDRKSLNKVPIIIVEPASNTNPIVNHQIPILKPKRRETEILGKEIDSSIIKAPSGSFSKRSKCEAKIDEDCVHDARVYQRKCFTSENLNVKSRVGDFRQTVRRTVLWSDTEEGEVSASDFYSEINIENQVQPCYVGSRTTNLICVSNDNVMSYIKVSLQLIDDKFMAIDDNNIAVDNVNLWTLLFSHIKSDCQNVLTLIFYDNCTTELENNCLPLLIRTLEFNDIRELTKFNENLSIYLRGFTITFENMDNISLTSLILICPHCLSPYKFHSKVWRPMKCQECSNSEFIFKKPRPVSLINQDKSVLINNEFSDEKIKHSPRPKSFLKQETSSYVIRALYPENLLNNSLCESGLSHDTSFCTALTNSNNHESGVSDINSDFGSQSSKLKNLDYTEITGDIEQTLDFDIALDKNVRLFDDQKTAFLYSPDENDSQIYLRKFISSDWIIHYPLSNVRINMNNIYKVDDRVKLHFLTRVMKGDEDIRGVFMSYMVCKVYSPSIIEVLVVLSNFRMWIYSWVDKNSLLLEDCLKLIVELKLKHLVYISDCLNHQWINLKFKGKKPPIILLIGDKLATKSILQIFAEAVSVNVAKLSIQTLKNIMELKASNFFNLINSTNEEMNIDTLNDCEYFLIKSCSVITENEITGLDFGTALLGVHIDNLVLINFRFQSKPHQINMELQKIFSIYILTNKIIVDDCRHNFCRLHTFENNVTKTINIEFISPSTRSTALLHIAKSWKELFQTDICFEISSIIDKEVLS